MSDEKALENILRTLESLEARLSLLEEKNPDKEDRGVKSKARKQSIKEFLIERAPRDEVQKTLVIANFLESVEGMSSFNKADIEKGYRLAKESVPKNINDKVNMSIKNGHLMEAEEKKDSMKAWVLTTSGEKYIAQKFKK